MEIRVRGRNGAIPQAVRRFAVEKLGHLPRYLSTITSIDVEIYEDGKPKTGAGQVAEVTVVTSGPLFRAKATSKDPRVSIDLAAARLERKVKEFKRMRSGKPAHHSSTKGKSADMVNRNRSE